VKLAPHVGQQRILRSKPSPSHLFSKKLMPLTSQSEIIQSRNLHDLSNRTQGGSFKYLDLELQEGVSCRPAFGKISSLANQTMSTFASFKPKSTFSKFFSAGRLLEASTEK
jgi:hypothetical protein